MPCIVLAERESLARSSNQELDIRTNNLRRDIYTKGKATEPIVEIDVDFIGV